MKRKSTQLLFQFALLIMLSFSNQTATAQVSSLTENFDQVVPIDWVIKNHTTGDGLFWAQGDVGKFNAYSGNTNSYAGVGSESVNTPIGIGTISNWLFTPELNLVNGATITFYTRTVADTTRPDRLEVRLSTSNRSTNIGKGNDSVGDFSTLLLTINPSLNKKVYPNDWTQYTVTLSGIPDKAKGRIAFRYYVTYGGPNGHNSTYIGIDDFNYQTTILPVTLLSFNGVIKDSKAMLTWKTADEINNKGFDVETSRDNANFSSVGFVAGNGNTSGISEYNFTDVKVLSGTNFYRLKQIDVDGNSKYSNVIKLDWKNFDWKIFGNASANNTWIQLQLDAPSSVAVQLVSINGQIIQTINKGSLAQGTYTIPLNLKNASQGLYIVRLSVDKNIYTKKLIR